MKRSFILILCVSVCFLGCGKARSKRLMGIIPTKGIAGLEEPVEHPIIGSELAIAIRVCDSLVAKRTLIESNISATPTKEVFYDFALENKKCDGKVDASETKAITTEITKFGTELEYGTDQATSYFKDVFTDKSEALELICAGLSAGQKIISNARMRFNRIYLVKFGKDELSFDTIQINTKDANTAAGLNVQVITLYTATTQIAAKDLGVEKVRVRFTPCRGKEFSTLKETFVRSVFP